MSIERGLGMNYRTGNFNPAHYHCVECVFPNHAGTMDSR